MVVPGMEAQTPLISIGFFAVALWAVVAYYVRAILRAEIPKYDIVNEIFHPAMQVVMGYMYLPLNWQIISYSAIAVVFALGGFYFIIRILYAEIGRKYFRNSILNWMVKEYKKLQYDRSHAILGFGTSLMFAPMRHIVIVDTLFTIFFLWIALKYVLETYRDLRNRSITGETMLCFVLSDVFHVVMGISMGLMNIWMFSVPTISIPIAFFCWLAYRTYHMLKIQQIERKAQLLSSH